MSVSTDSGQSQPDLRAAICDAMNSLLAEASLPAEMRLSAPLQPDQVVIRCQRTWHDVTTLNQHLNGGSFSARVAQFEDGGKLHSYFVEAARRVGSGSWGIAGSSGGVVPEERRDEAGGFMGAGGSHVCVGGLGYIPEGGTVRAEDRAWIGTGGPPTGGAAPAARPRHVDMQGLSPAPQRVIELATQDARGRGTGYIGREHAEGTSCEEVERDLIEALQGDA